MRCPHCDLEIGGAEPKVGAREIKTALRKIAAILYATRNADEIVLIVANFLHVPVDQILSQRRTQHIAAARHAAMWLMRRHTEMSFEQIGEYFNRDHTSVVYAVNRMVENDVLRMLDGMVREQQCKGS